MKGAIITGDAGEKFFTVKSSLEKTPQLRLGRPMNEQESRIYYSLSKEDKDKLLHLPANAQREFFDSLKKYF